MAAAQEIPCLAWLLFLYQPIFKINQNSTKYVWKHILNTFMDIEKMNIHNGDT